MDGPRDPELDAALVSQFEFLDDEEDLTGKAEVLAPLEKPLPWPRMAWELTEAGAAELSPVTLPWIELLRPRPSRDALAQRWRLEPPVFGAWLILSCCFPLPLLWIALGIGMIGFSWLMRAPFALIR